MSNYYNNKLKVWNDECDEYFEFAANLIWNDSKLLNWYNYDELLIKNTLSWFNLISYKMSISFMQWYKYLMTSKLSHVT